MMYSLGLRVGHAIGCEMVKALKSAGIHANVSTGGFLMSPEDGQVTLMFETVAKFTDEVPIAGNTMMSNIQTQNAMIETRGKLDIDGLKRLNGEVVE